MATIAVTGVLDFDTVPLVWKNTLAEFRRDPAVELDFSAVTQCNSAALALLFEWVRLADRLKKNLTIRHVPDRLKIISSACGINRLPGILL